MLVETIGERRGVQRKIRQQGAASFLRILHGLQRARVNIVCS
jgi:hypothetical protein